MSSRLYPNALAILALIVASVVMMPLCSDALADEAAKIEVGKPAPAFTLPDQDSKNIALADLKGKWVVVYFYPKDETPGCTIEACEFTGDIANIEKLGAVVLGVSPDSPASHQKFIAKEKLKFTLLADEKKETIKSYEAWDTTKNRVQRSTVLIDPKGDVAFRWEKVVPKGHAAAVKAKIEELQKSQPASK